MYINKMRYYIGIIITGIGNYFWGALTLILLAGVLIPSQKNGFSDIYSVTGAFFTIWAGHYFIGDYLKKVKFYNTFFENDRDGYLQVRVIGKAIGKDEAAIVNELKILCKLHLLRNVMLEEGERCAVVLQNPNLKGKMHSRQRQLKICSHCGGKNEVLPGFVNKCQYCDGSLS